jgi:hypothetical protein
VYLHLEPTAFIRGTVSGGRRIRGSRRGIRALWAMTAVIIMAAMTAVIVDFGLSTLITELEVDHGGV